MVKIISTINVILVKFFFCSYWAVLRLPPCSDSTAVNREHPMKHRELAMKMYDRWPTAKSQNLMEDTPIM